MEPRARHRHLGSLAATIAVAVVAAGCAFVPVATRPAVVDGSPDRPCTAAAVRSCALPYPSDDFTVADILMTHVLAAASTDQTLLAPHPHVSAYLQRCLDRPAWKRVVAAYEARVEAV